MHFKQSQFKISTWTKHSPISNNSPNAKASIDLIFQQSNDISLSSIKSCSKNLESRDLDTDSKIYSLL